jgi:type III secretion system low calcium response chaperone LcrH/SycD
MTEKQAVPASHFFPLSIRKPAMEKKSISTTEGLNQAIEAVLSGATLGDVAGITQDALESLYGLAFNLYNNGNYKDAETLFKGLCLYDHHDERFWMGLAGCLQAQGQLEGAIDAYGMASVAGALSSPAPSLYAGICCLKLKRQDDAAALFDIAKGLGNPENEEHKALRQRAADMLDLCQAAAPAAA